MMNFLTHLLTERDNATFDISRVLWAVSVMTFLALAIYAVHKGQAWDPQAFGMGLGAVMAAGGAVVVVKAAKAEGQ